MSDEILAPIFEKSLSLDHSGDNFKVQAMSVWERMADTLDQIAANTRGGRLAQAVAVSLAKTVEGHSTSTSGNSRNRHSLVPRTTNPHLQKEPVSPALTPSAVANAVVAKIAHSKGTPQNDRHSRRTGESGKRPALNHTFGAFPQSTHDGVKSAIATPVAATKSQQASAANREERTAERQGSIIANAVVKGFGKFGDWGKTGMEAVKEDSDAKDAAGYAIAGPLYGVAKELQQVLPDSMKERLEGQKLSSHSEGNASDENKKKRDAKGRFLPDRNTIRRETTQIEIAESELELQEKESKAEEKRHKELVRAIRTSNKEGLLDRFLDNRRSRDRIIRERDRRGRSPDVDLDMGHERDRGSRRTASRKAGRRRGGLLGRFGRLGRSGIGRSIVGAGRGTLALGSKGALGAAKLIPGLGQLLAAGMAIYDGVQGWDDTEIQREAFGLAEGQEATTGQKASTAIANIIDMGGLGTGLLGLLGVDVDTATIARNIYDFGSGIAKAGCDFVASYGEKASAIWGGLTDMGSRIWSGAQEIGGAISGFAGDTLEKGSSLLTGIWDGATGFLGNIWSDLTDFAQSGIAEAGEMLSGLWKNVSELPEKIADGVKNLASGAVETGEKLISAGKDALDAGIGWAGEKANSVWEDAKDVASSSWDTVKSWGSNLFDFLGPSEAKAAEPDSPPAQSTINDTQAEMNETMCSVDEAMQEQNKLLTSIDNALNAQQHADTFGIAGALGGVRDAIRAVRTGGSGYASGLPNSAYTKILRDSMAKGGNEAVQTGVSAMIAEATADAKARNVQYQMGAKDSSTGAIDCSGWVQEMSNQLMSSMNEAMEQEVFSAEARQAFNKGAQNEGAAGIVRAVSEQTGQLYTNEQLSPEMAKEGMVIGLDTGHRGWEAGRFKDIDHVVQTYRDPVTGELMVSESRGGKGVMSSRYADWYAQQQKRGTKLYGADLTAMADSSKVAPIQPTDGEGKTTLANTATSTEVPVSTAQIIKGTEAQSGRQADSPNAVRTILPPQSMGGDSKADNASLLVMLGKILAAIEAGNRKMAGMATGGDGLPPISMDYDDPAMQSMARDFA